ncbi:nucleoside-specific channel-forming protein Tsx, partial [Pseudomonas sp. SIMBA_068]
MHSTSRRHACVGVSLLLAAVTGVLSAPILAQPTPVDDSAQGETLSPQTKSPEASPAKKGAYLSDWFNQDLTL